MDLKNNYNYCLFRLNQANFWEIIINGIFITKSTKISQQIAYIPEIVQLYGKLSRAENLDFFSPLAGQKHSQSQLFDYLVDGGLPKKAMEQPLENYSKGMRQKVGIAIALSENASFILMDEPTSDLDAKAYAKFSRICNMLSENGTTIFMATHDIFNAVNMDTIQSGFIPKNLQERNLKSITHNMQNTIILRERALVGFGITQCSKWATMSLLMLD